MRLTRLCISLAALSLGLTGCLSSTQRNIPKHYDPIKNQATQAMAGGPIGKKKDINPLADVLPSGYAKSRAGQYYLLRKQGVQFIKYGDTVTFVLPNDKFFVYGSHNLDPKQYLAMHHMTNIIRMYPKTRIDIFAYTDNVGASRRNIKYSQGLAQSVKAYFWAHGVALDRMHAVGFGEMQDVASNRTVQGSYLNRRVEVRLWIA